MRFGIFAIVLSCSLFFLPASAGAFSCSVTATAVSFGAYDILSPTPKDATGTVNISCKAPPQNPNAPIAVIISLSAGTSGSFYERQMQPSAGSDFLKYNLFTTPSFSTVWGDGSNGSETLTNLVTRNTPWNATIYGRIPARQNVSAGIFTDVITVTIEW